MNEWKRMWEKKDWWGEGKGKEKKDNRRREKSVNENGVRWRKNERNKKRGGSIEGKDISIFKK